MTEPSPRSPKFPNLAHARAYAAGAVVVVVAIGGTFAGGSLGARTDHRAWRSPDQLAGLLDSGGGKLKVLVDRHGKPLLGANGKPLHVAGNGTIVDSTGRPVLSRSGKPLKVGANGHIPSQALRRPSGSAPHGAPGSAPVVNNSPGSGAGTGASGAPITIGVEGVDPAAVNQTYAQYGGRVEASDAGLAGRATADWINANGGIGGHRLDLRVVTTNFDTPPQKVCDEMTAAPTVVAIVNFSNSQCRSRTGIPSFSDNPSAYTTDTYARSPDSLFTPGSLAVERYADPYVQGLATQGFFGGSAKVGLLIAESSTGDVNVGRVSGGLRAALSREGVRIAAEQTFSSVGSPADVPGLIAQLAQGVIRFRQAGVDRIVSADANGIYLALFMKAAEPQGYRPRYGVSSLNEPALLRASVSVAQLRGAVGIGWSPLTDVGPEQEGSAPASRALCRQIFTSAGIGTGSRFDSGEYQAVGVCDTLMLLRQVIPRYGTSPAGIRTGIESLGTSRNSALNLSTRLDATHHDGAAGYRLLRFEDGCSCFQYQGPVYSTG